MNINLARSRFVQIFVILITTVGIAVVDVATGSETRLYPLYFVPIVIAGSRIGKSAAIVVSQFCTVLWVISNVLDGAHFSSIWFWVLNAGAQGFSFLCVAILVSRIHAAMLQEKETACVDRLTELLNTRGFYERAPALIALCHRENKPVVIACLDLDNFKKVNDTQGHQRGNEVLRIVAQTMKANFRMTDLLGRVGGDEFVALLPNASGEAAEELLERVRKAVESSMQSEGCDVTLSIGAIAYRYPLENFDAVVEAADKEMYIAKQSGKNRILVRKIASLAEEGA